MKIWEHAPEHDYEKHYKLKEGDVFVEGGAFVGRYARKASSKVGNSGRVVSIEPSPLNLITLRESLEGINNVTIVEKALWNKKGKGELTLFSPREDQSQINSGDMLKAVSGIRENVTYVDIKTDTLDNILADLGIESVNLLGWDIEGAEVGALEGMKKSLSSGSILNMGLCFYHKAESEIRQAINTIKSYENYQFIENDRGILYAGLK